MVQESTVCTWYETRGRVASQFSYVMEGSESCDVMPTFERACTCRMYVYTLYMVRNIFLRD